VSQENVEIVRKLIALAEQVRYSEQPLPHTDLMTPDAEIDLSRRVFNPEVYRGYKGLARLNAELRETWADWRVTAERFADAGDRVVTIETIRGRGRGSGSETVGRYASTWTLASGRVTRVEVGLQPDEALKDVGLEE
jgi:ketosteroid isomerase-like protein